MALGLPTPTLADTRDLRAAPLDLRESPDDATPWLREVGTHLIRVLIADCQPVMRAGLRTVLEREQDIPVVGEAASGSDDERRTPRVYPPRRYDFMEQAAMSRAMDRL